MDGQTCLRLVIFLHLPPSHGSTYPVEGVDGVWAVCGGKGWKKRDGRENCG